MLRLIRTISRMNLRMLGWREGDEVGRVVIERVLIFMVDMPAVRDLFARMRREPDIAVQVGDAICGPALIIDPVTPTGAIGIASVSIAFEDDFSGVFVHADSISPHTNESISFQPLFSVQIR